MSVVGGKLKLKGNKQVQLKQQEKLSKKDKHKKKDKKKRDKKDKKEKKVNKLNLGRVESNPNTNDLPVEDYHLPTIPLEEPTKKRDREEEEPEIDDDLKWMTPSERSYEIIQRERVCCDVFLSYVNLFSSIEKNESDETSREDSRGKD
jgi:hypothetical protein